MGTSDDDTSWQISTTPPEVPQPFRCWTCSKLFATTFNLRRHEEIVHRNPNSGYCYCPVPNCARNWRAFSSADNVVDHVKRQHGEGVYRVTDLYSCPIPNCENHARGFSSLQIWSDHLKRVHITYRSRKLKRDRETKDWELGRYTDYILILLTRKQWIGNVVKSFSRNQGMDHHSSC
jgi:hypothetical protein